MGFYILIILISERPKNLFFRLVRSLMAYGYLDTWKKYKCVIPFSINLVDFLSFYILCAWMSKARGLVILLYFLLLSLVYGTHETHETQDDNCTIVQVVEESYATFRPSWYTFHPMSYNVYLGIASLCVANAFFGCFLVVLHVTIVARSICHRAWDEVCERLIGSEDELPEYLEDIDWKGVGYKPIFEWGDKGKNNPYIYELSRLYSEDSMTVEEQKSVHMSVIQALYISRNRGFIFIWFSAMFCAYTTMCLFGFVLIPGDEMSPETMEFSLMTVFVPQGFLVTFFLLLAFQSEYQYHNLSIYAVFIVVLCFQIPRAIISITLVSGHMSPLMVGMNWMVVLMAFHHTLGFPTVSGKGELKKHIRHYIRAYKHVRNLDKTEKAFIVERGRKLRDQNAKRRRLLLPTKHNPIINE